MPAGASSSTNTKPGKPIKSVAFVSLGCPKNLVDSERMLGLLAEDGLAITNDAARADAIEALLATRQRTVPREAPVAV